jgi:hypothetical protein
MKQHVTIRRPQPGDVTVDQLLNPVHIRAVCTNSETRMLDKGALLLYMHRINTIVSVLCIVPLMDERNGDGVPSLTECGVSSSDDTYWCHQAPYPRMQISALATCIDCFLNDCASLSAIPRQGLALVWSEAMLKNTLRHIPASLTPALLLRLSVVLKQLGNSFQRSSRRLSWISADATPLCVVVPRVCCVLNQADADERCPMCPRRHAIDRVTQTQAWIESLDVDTATRVLAIPLLDAYCTTGHPQ